MSLLRSISGLRATLGDNLTPSIIASYASAFSTILPEGPIVVGNDGRPSGKWIEDVVVGSLRACGRTVRMLGMVPTPTVQLFVEKSNAVGGIIVTASHNPAEWNGLKFLDATGVFLDERANQELWNSVDSSSFKYSNQQQHGSVELVPDAIEVHLQSVRPFLITAASENNDKPRAVVDAVNCSGSVVVPRLLEELGYDVVPLFCDSSGVFPHKPEPLSENLESLGDEVVKTNAAIGIAVDPDADRLVLFDEKGHAIGEELTIALATMAALERYAKSGKQANVVVNYSTTRVVDDVAKTHNANVLRASVGEINVVRKMQAHDALIGGEGSGGVIFPSVHAGRDSLVGIALILSMLHSKNQTLSEACDAIPRYSMHKTKLPLENKENIEKVLERVVEFGSDGKVSTEDGVYVSWPDRWLHVRASNTEPILRIIAESPTAEETEHLVAQVKRLV